jgi:small-conductance mechanosensitive channel
MNNMFRNWEILVAGLWPRLAWAAVFLVASYYLARIASQLVEKMLLRRQVDPGAGKLVVELTRWSIFTTGVLLALQQFMDVTAFLAGLGILGFTVGFALQDVMKNFAAGVLLLVQKPFRVGDQILVQEFTGRVAAIDLRSTELITTDGLTVILPNADVLNHAIVNYTRSINRRVDVPIGIAYGSNLELAREAAMKAVLDIPGVLKDPAPQALFETFNASSIDFRLYFWVNTSQLSVVSAKGVAVQAVKKAFDEQKIEIPFPIQTLLVKSQK